MHLKNKYNYFDIFTLFVKIAPREASIYTFIYIISFAIPALKIMAVAYFIDTAEHVALEEIKLEAIVIPIVLLLLFAFYDNFIAVIKSLIKCHTENKINLAVMPQIVERMAKIKYKYYENQKDADVIYRVCDKFSDNIMEMYLLVYDSLKSLFDIIGFVVILGMQLWWSSIMLIVLCVPIYLIGYRAGTKKYDIDKELTKIDRRVWYKYGLLTNREAVDERYVFGYSNKIMRDFKVDFEYARVVRKKNEKKQAINLKFSSLLVTVSSIIIISILILPTIKGDVSIGMFTSLAGTIFTLRSTLSTGITQYILNFKYKIEYIKDLNEFLEYENNEGYIDRPEINDTSIKTIEFKDVSFKYPGAREYILRNMSFRLHAGKNYVIVGANGAGKTTLTKLLTGLYDEYEGNIYINGRELREYTPAELMSLVAVVYQDFSRYPLNVYDNIAIGNILDMENKKKVEEVVNILELEDILKRLPKGYETPVTKVKNDGVDLSGGEWQRIALARLLVNDAPLKILDEPTAALDPVAESRVYNEFGEIIGRKNNKDNITIFISHRLASAKLADEILVLDEGAILEQGTFKELISEGNIFAEMYEKQAEWYENGA